MGRRPITVWLLLALSACAAEDADAGRDAREAAERAALHGAEVAVLWRTATTELEAGRPGRAAAAVALGATVDPERFLPLVDRVAASDDPDALAILAARVDRERFGARADRLAIDHRYDAAALAETLAGLAGVERAHGVRVLAGVDAEYVVPVDADAMEAAVDRRFRDLADSAAVRAAWPTWDGSTGGDTSAERSSGRSVVERIDAALGRGLPEAVVVAEAVSAALAALDPYTVPVWPAALTGWEEHHVGAYVGIGVDLADLDGGVWVTGVSVDGPAWTAGVHVGDRVVAIDGASTAGQPAAAVAGALHGDPGTSVTVGVDRGGSVPLAVVVPRASIREQTVFGYRRTASGWDPWVEPGIALVRIAAFRPHTDDELDGWIPAERPAVAVIDLRGNSGGDVMAAVNVADRFVTDGPLAFLEGRTLAPPQPGPNGELPWNQAVPGHPLEGVPLVVLVDHQTASAAELVAGALRERAGAVLVGERTFGKGLSQALRTDAALKVGWQVTDGTWLLPSRKALQQPGGAPTGLDVDVAVALSPAESIQVEAMTRRRQLPTAHPDLGLSPRSELPRLTDDPQLVAALRVARARAAPGAAGSRPQGE
ncbi:MAG: S41 family peptidase [Myxococcota bacterium]